MDRNNNPNNFNNGNGSGFFDSDINDFSNFPNQADFLNANNGNQGFTPQSINQGQLGNQGFNPQPMPMNNQGFTPQPMPMNQGQMGNQGFNPQPMPMNNGKKQKAPKQSKAPKQPKTPKQPNQQLMGQQNRKKFNPLLIFIPVVLILVLIVLGVSLIGGNDDIPVVENPPVVETPPVVENPPVETPPVENPPIETPPVVETPPVENPPEEVVEYSYENNRIGLKFNYDSSLYSKENVEEIFNVIKASIPADSGRTEFNIFTDKLVSTLNVVKLTTGGADGLYISVSILPFEIEKEITTLKIDGTTETTNESIEAVDLTDEELIEKYDTQIKATLEQTGCEIISYNTSTVGGVGSELLEDGTQRLKGIFTSRIYSGPVEVTTSTGVVDVIQCTIPVGKNAILITAVTDGREIDIDKSVIFNEIVNSIVVTAREPEPELDENIEVVGGETAETEVNNTENKN